MTLRPLLLGSLLPALALGMWAWVGHGDWQRHPLFVSPEQVAQALLDGVGSGVVWQALSASLARCLLGLGIGAVSGLGTGLLLGLSRLGRRLLQPSLRTLQQISLFAWIPLIMAWFGLGEPSKIVFIALAAFFPVMVNTFDGVRGVPAPLVEVGRIYGFSAWQTVTRVIVPAALPAMFTGLFVALIHAWLATLGAEYLMTQGHGLGSLLVDAQDQYRTEQVLMGLVVVALVSLLLNLGVDRLQGHLLRWRAA